MLHSHCYDKPINSIRDYKINKFRWYIFCSSKIITIVYFTIIINDYDISKKLTFVTSFIQIQLQWYALEFGMIII